MSKEKSENNTLGVISLVLACLSLIFGPLTFIPGIVCGHMSIFKEKINKCAIIGLIIAYLFLFLHTILLLIFFFTTTHE